MNKIRAITPRADGLDRLSKTFSKDKEFCESLSAVQTGNVVRMFVYLRWARKYMPHIQDELSGMVPRLFSTKNAEAALFWTLSLTGGTIKDLGLIPYLVVRGLIWDAGYVVRRSLENAGVLAHLWQRPEAASYLSDPDSGAFRNAFINEIDKSKASILKASGIQKRFAACALGKPMSDLYRLVSAYSIHGGSPNQMVISDWTPTRVSCLLINRPDPLEKDLTKALQIFVNACEILCFEIVHVHGTFAKRFGLLPSKGGEGGFYLTKLLDPGPGSELDHLVKMTLREFGWSEMTTPSKEPRE